MDSPKSVDSLEQSTVISWIQCEVGGQKRLPSGETELHKACQRGWLIDVKNLLKKVDVNVQDFRGRTPLHAAIISMQMDVVKFLLDYGALPGVPDSQYVTPLHIAVKKRNVYLTELLVKYGADPRCFNKKGQVPLELCAEDDYLRAACLMWQNNILRKCYYTPWPNVFSVHLTFEDFTKISDYPGVTVASMDDFLANGNVTYFVIDHYHCEVVNSIQAAMLQGSCIVTSKWIHDFVNDKPNLNILEYLPHIPGYAIEKSVLNTLNKLPKLFDGLFFYFCQSDIQQIQGCSYSFADLATLVRLGGGKIFKNRPLVASRSDRDYPYHVSKTDLTPVTYYLIYDDARYEAVEYTPGIQYKSSKWLIECINAFSIVP